MSTYSDEVPAVAMSSTIGIEPGDLLAIGVRAGRPDRQRVFAGRERAAVELEADGLGRALAEGERARRHRHGADARRAARRSTGATLDREGDRAGERRAVRCSGWRWTSSRSPSPPVVAIENTWPEPVVEKSRATAADVDRDRVVVVREIRARGVALDPDREMPAGRRGRENVVHVIVVAGVAGFGVKVSGASLPVVSGLVGSPQSVNADVVTVPENALFFVADMVIALFRFWVVPIVTVEGDGEREVGDRHDRAGVDGGEDLLAGHEAVVDRVDDDPRRVAVDDRDLVVRVGRRR